MRAKLPQENKHINNNNNNNINIVATIRAISACHHKCGSNIKSETANEQRWQR